MATSGSQTVSVDGHRLSLTNLDKVMYPATGTTKGEVIDYYSRIADVLVPYAADRPATRKRWVNGVGTDEHPGDVFFQKDLDERSTPSWIARRTLHHEHSDNAYPLVNDRATLVWLAQIASLEIHVPQWRFGPRGAQRHPDRFVIDLDPGEGVGLAECAEVARWARDILTGMGLAPMPVTSGSKGIHLYARLDGSQTSAQVADVAHELARALEADHPDLVVSDMKKAKRVGKVLVDWSQNNGNKTTVAPYSLRGRSHPTVAAPRTWRELAAKDLRHLEFEEVLDRVARRGDILSPLRDGAASTIDSPGEGDARDDRLATYRSMRDATRTPEPVPDRVTPGSGDSFVIQEHHASHLHWDFRLEHDGVLVSWALPKGMPTDVGHNHLAVQTEDHPLEYGGFEGDIPQDEYGGGHVDIWDRGTFELEKWREGKEIIATLHGEKHGTHRYALIHTGGGKGERNWLIHLTKEQPTPDAATTAPARTRVAATRPVAASEKPMLATLGTIGRFEPDDGWAYEMKWDGIRLLARVAQGAFSLTTRNGHGVTATYPELADLLRAVEVDVTLDGEVVAPDRTGRPDFGRLQERSGLTAPKDVERARARVPVQYLVFDILDRDGVSVVARSYDERRGILESTVRSTGAVQVPPAFDGDLDEALATSSRLGLEGVMAKRRDARYTPGRRSSDWVKLKHHRAQEVVVIGWREGGGSRAGRIGSLLVAVPDDDGLHYVGRVGTGFRERDLDEAGRRLARIARTTPPVADVPAADARDAHWVRASLVGEVEFAEWTSSGRLRQPRWRGWRDDKSPADVTREG